MDFFELLERLKTFREEHMSGYSASRVSDNDLIKDMAHVFNLSINIEATIEHKAV